MDDVGHDLVIGGSGMLAGLVESLAQRGRQVSVVARGAARLQRLAARRAGIHPLSLDYRDAAALALGLDAAIAMRGPFRRAVVWDHDDDQERALRIATRTTDVYCQVLGSAAADPAGPERLSAWQAAFQPRQRPALRLAILGFKTEGGRSRWLTDPEISAGVGEALESAEPVTIVGTVTPWLARP